MERNHWREIDEIQTKAFARQQEYRDTILHMRKNQPAKDEYPFPITPYNQRVQLSIPSERDAQDGLDEIPSHEKARLPQLDNL